jgi:hypothetical protein
MRFSIYAVAAAAVATRGSAFQAPALQPRFGIQVSPNEALRS